MKRNTWLSLSLAAALLGGAAFAQERMGDKQTDPKNQPGQQGWQTGATAKLDENQIKQIFQQKNYLQGLQITPRIEGDVVTLEGNVPSKAHVVAALLAVYELPNVKHVNCKLNFTETPGQIGMTRPGEQDRSGALGGERREGATLGAGASTAKQIEVVAAIFPVHKGAPGTLPAGMREQVDVIIFRPMLGSQYQGQSGSGLEKDRPFGGEEKPYERK